jgi:hypothetical protein
LFVLADEGVLPKARLRQLAALALPNVGMASAIDIADSSGPFWPGSIHPRHKQPLGHRLSLEARRIAYGDSVLLSRGPQIRNITGFNACDLDFSCGSYHEKDAFIFRLAFDSVGTGLDVRSIAAPMFIMSFDNESMPLPNGTACRVPCGVLPNQASPDTIDIDRKSVV